MNISNLQNCCEDGVVFLLFNFFWTEVSRLGINLVNLRFLMLISACLNMYTHENFYIIVKI